MGYYFRDGVVFLVVLICSNLNIDFSENRLPFQQSQSQKRFTLRYFIKYISYIIA
jgi:hypothetical protein